MFLKILLCVFIILLGLWILSAWIHLPTPANISLMLPKKWFSSTISQLLIVLLVILLSESVIFLYHTAAHQAIDSFYLYTYFLLWLFTLVGFMYCDMIRHAVVSTRQPLLEKTNHERRIPLPPFEEKDLTTQKSAKQFTFYIPRQGLHQKTCIFYLNYERWSPRTSTAEAVYLRNLALKEGYSFCLYSGKGVDEVYLSGIIADIRQALTVLGAHTPATEVILAGSASGGHLALASALSHQSKELSPAFSSPRIGGVIALYPIVDLADNYISFTCKDESSESPLDHLGNYIFNGLIKDGSFQESYQRLMQRLIGGSYEKLAPLYEMASIKSMLDAQDFPIFIIHGSHDSFCPIESVRTLYQLMKAQDKTVSFLELPCVDHSFDTLFTDYSIVGHKVRREIIKWLYTYFRT